MSYGFAVEARTVDVMLNFFFPTGLGIEEEAGAGFVATRR